MSDHVALSLAFDPSESPHYKVFCLGKTSNSSVLCHLEVYSSNEGPWRRVASVPSFTLPPTVTELEAIKTLPLPSLDHQDDEDPPDDVGTLRWIYAFTVIGFVKEEIDAEPYIVLHIPNKAVKYNFINKTFKKLCSFEPSQDDGVDNFYGSRRSFKFIESLANV
ncbi:hypothetical protein DY000_02000329 [Brassica cretica]|uniref:F-box associated domain-containing protein n=1 Tax=Brassica cretica TaxID=69181 RepID=A0ABQ7CBQ0_BRACR|nr:hypothetical protein DY000_02000329 [Brassica cretica]